MREQLRVEPLAPHEQAQARNIPQQSAFHLEARAVRSEAVDFVVRSDTDTFDPPMVCMSTSSLVT